MRPIGKILLGLLAAVFIAPTDAALIAQVDRDRISLGDSLRLSITGTDGDSTEQLELAPLYRDFDVLQRSSKSSTQILNGKRTQTRQLILQISPKREGTLQIPPLRAGGVESNMLLVAVGPAPAAGDPQQSIIFTAEVDKESVYVQGQILLTLRVQQAINLESRSVTEVQLDYAFVKALEQKSFQRTVDGRAWLVHELRYAIFPEQSGTLIIPSQGFTARESIARRSMFDSSAGPMVRRTTKQLSINVLPRPAEFTGGTWLPARNLQIEESWSSPPDSLRVGDSATRTLRISGEGLQGAQLPPVFFNSTDGLRYYPDQPQISDAEVSSGLMGVRIDSAALVPTAAGEWTLPELRIPWWDTATEQMRYAIVPARSLNVLPAPVGAGESLPTQTTQSTDLSNAAQASASSVRLWQIVAAASLLGWMLTLVFLWRSRKGAVTVAQAERPTRPGESRLFRELSAACASNQPLEARRLLLAWYREAADAPTPGSLASLAHDTDDEQLANILQQLDRALYAGDGKSWDGSALGSRLRSLRKQLSERVREQARRSRSPTLALYQ
ncbi:MAG: BatD family protein [Pseudomonadota bacterium]